MIALLDADVLCYRAAAVAVNEVQWDDEDGPLTMANSDMAIEVVEYVVGEWTKAAKSKRHVLVFSDRSAPKTSFRYHICPIYKGNRPDEKPPLHDFIHDYLANKAAHKTLVLPGLEGDDALGLMGTGPDGNKYALVSIDKDMLTLPARICNSDDKEPHVRKIKPREADWHWMVQTITGDTVDNYKGAPGAGIKRAEKELALTKNLNEMWPRVVDVFVDQYDKSEKNREKFLMANPWEEALMNARCARILRHGDYDPSAQMIRLWHPEPEAEEWISPF